MHFLSKGMFVGHAGMVAWRGRMVRGGKQVEDVV